MSQSSVCSVISEPSSVRSDLFADKPGTAQAYHRLVLQNCRRAGPHGCLESGRASKSDSDSRPTLKVNKRTVSGHVLSMTHKRIEAGQDNWDSSLHVSHLCHNTKCVRPDHLVLETPEVNNTRNQCTELRCVGCTVSLTNCVHRPACLLTQSAGLCSMCKAVFD
jgi:hypothetical protein